MSTLKISISPFILAGSVSHSTHILPTAICPFKGTFCIANKCSFFTAVSEEERLKKNVIGSCSTSVSLCITDNKEYPSILDLGSFRKPIPQGSICPIIRAECKRSRCVRFKASVTAPDKNQPSERTGQCKALENARLQLAYFGAIP
jgi:hypothetical protein